MTVAKLRRATRNRANAERAWKTALREAHDAGMSLREIARCVGVSHVRVQQILRSE